MQDDQKELHEVYPKHYIDLFKIDRDNSMAFVGMSFASEDRWRWEDVIKPALLMAGLDPYRVDMEMKSDSILVDILRAIVNSRFLVFDITMNASGFRSGNVMYDLGYAHAIRSPEDILVIRSDNEILPFDTAQIRVFSYTDASPEARKSLAATIGSVLQNAVRVRDLVVGKAISMLDEVSLGFLSSHAKMEYFSLTESTKAFTPEALAARSAIRGLLELGIVGLRWDRPSQKYAYTWTGLGRTLLDTLGFLDSTHIRAVTHEQPAKLGYTECNAPLSPGHLL